MTSSLSDDGPIVATIRVRRKVIPFVVLLSLGAN